MRVIPLFTLLVASVFAQVQIDKNPDPKWPKIDTTELDYIPKGTTVNNTEGYYLDGSYKIITNMLGDRQLEFTMTLHQGKQNTDWLYMVYLQMIRPDPTDVPNYKPWYESYTCAIRYNSLSVQSVDNSNVWFYGYKGNS